MEPSVRQQRVIVCCKQGHKQRDCPQSQQGTARKAIHGQSHGQTPKQQPSTSGPVQYTRSKTTGWPLRLPPPDLVKTRPSQTRWLRRSNLLRLKRLRKMMTTCKFACGGRRWHQWITGSPRWYSTTFPRLGPHNAAPVLHSVSVWLSAPESQQWRGDLTRVSRDYSLADMAIRQWIRWRLNRTWRP